MIALNGLSFRYAAGQGMALDSLNLKIAAGEFVGVTGPSGAGKTTLTRVLNGVVPHHFSGDFYGSALVNGKDTVDTSLTELAREVGSVFQDVDGQMVSSMVEDEARFALENFGYPQDQIESRLAGALEQVGISHLRYRALDSLSGGQKQKVALAAAIALRPRLLVLDEPTGELDPQSSVQVYEILREMNQQGTTIVVVEQKIMLLCAYAQRLIGMEGGKIVLDGTVRQVAGQVERLRELGVNAPRVASLAAELRRRGLYAGETPLNVDEAERMAREVLA